ncbi:MAG: coproporphyrinogen III oxidase, partial [Sphingomonas sp.]
MQLDEQQIAARHWFETLRDRICAAFESIERDAGSDAVFDYTAWDRVDPSGEPGGGGVRGVMKGRVFEKVGVNVSTVGGTFEGEFGKTIHGADADPRFFATGISLVAHLANPHAPAVHMNCRFLRTTKQWFGGGADLNPPLPVEADTADFHAAMKAACDAHEGGYYPRFKEWADEYFYIPHRQVHRGVGGICFDHLENGFDEDFAFVRDVGEAFLAI